MFTSYYSAVYRHQKAHVDLPILPVRISVACPRFWPVSRSFAVVDELVPKGIFGVVDDPPEYERRYRERLAKFGPERILHRLAAIEKTTDKPLCLLCFEKEPERCHRTWAREFLSAHIEIVEWEPPSAQTRLEVEL